MWGLGKLRQQISVLHAHTCLGQRGAARRGRVVAFPGGLYSVARRHLTSVDMEPVREKWTKVRRLELGHGNDLAIAAWSSHVHGQASSSVLGTLELETPCVTDPHVTSSERRNTHGSACASRPATRDAVHRSTQHDVIMASPAQEPARSPCVMYDRYEQLHQLANLTLTFWCVNVWAPACVVSFGLPC